MLLFSIGGLSMKGIWRVYDDRELRYLQEHGFRYELLARDIRTDTKMFLFANSEELQEALGNYKREVLGN